MILRMINVLNISDKMVLRQKQLLLQIWVDHTDHNVKHL